MTNSIQAAQVILGTSRLPRSADFRPPPAAGEPTPATEMRALTTNKTPATFASLSNALLAQSIPIQLSSSERRSPLTPFASNQIVPLPGELLLSVRQELTGLARSALQELNRLAQVPQTPLAVAGNWRGPQAIAALNDPALTRELMGLISRFGSTSSALGDLSSNVGTAETVDVSIAARAAQLRDPSTAVSPPVSVWRETTTNRSGERLRQASRPLPPANRNETAVPKQRQKKAKSSAEKVLESLVQLLRLGGHIASRAFGY